MHRLSSLTWVVALLMLYGCASQKQMHQHATHTTTVDTMATEAKTDGHHHQTGQDIDSIVTASVWAALAEFASQEHEKETTTETITTWVDSLGREMRQEQRTTQRELSRQEQQRQQQQMQQLTTELSRQISELDSVWSQRLSTVERHLRDSIDQTVDKQSRTAAASAPSWWQRLWAWLKGSLIGLVMGAVSVFFFRKSIIDFIKNHYV